MLIKLVISQSLYEFMMAIPFHLATALSAGPTSPAEVDYPVSLSI